MRRDLAWIPVALLLVSAAEAALAVVTALTRGWQQTTWFHVTGAGLVSLALAVVLATLLPREVRLVRWVVAVGASLLAVGWLVLAALTGVRATWSWDEWWMSLVSPAVQLLLAAWAWLELEPGSAPPPQPIDPRRSGGTGELPVSAETPPAREWNRSSTPWPRKDVDDPQGTLIRPPQVPRE